VRLGLKEIRALAAAEGRDNGDIKALAGAQIVVGQTRAAAEAKLADYQRHYAPEASLAAFAGWSGLDIARYRDDEVIQRGSNHTQSAADAAPLLAGDIRRRYAKVEGNSALTFVGTPDEVATQIEQYVDASGIDGFLLHQFVSPASFEDFATLAVPALKDRGLFRTAPAEGTLRSRLRADGAHRLPDSHPGARFRAWSHNQ